MIFHEQRTVAPTNGVFMVLVVASLVGSCGRETRRAEAPSAGEELELELDERVEPYVPWALERRSRPSRVTPEREARRAPPVDDAPAGANVVSYRSGGLVLRGWYAPPARTGAPAIVYLHNDFVLEEGSWSNSKPFRDAGFATFLPALRGENDNPGRHELLFGEVDDARSAVDWIAGQPGVDAAHIYVVGHSIGGGIASLLALDPASKARATASVGGTYRAATFRAWSSRPEDAWLVRFPLDDPFEVSTRLLVSHVREVRRPHWIFAGVDDPWDMRYGRFAADLGQRAGVPITFVAVPGDHMSSIRGATAALLATIRREER